MPKTYPWLARSISPHHTGANETRRVLTNHKLHTVCDAAKCPNLYECFSRQTVTFLILGDICTRRCAFCAVKKGVPAAVAAAPDEPERISRAVKELNLRYAVITSVTRDDLADGGAGHFAAVLKYMRQNNPDVKVELLIPDFQGNITALTRISKAGPDVAGHNLETVPRLYQEIRNNAGYQRSLSVIEFLKTFGGFLVKSGLMLGLGEEAAEVLAVMRDLKQAGCDIITLGQYLPPAKKNVIVKQYINPERFQWYEQNARDMGFKYVFSGPFVRSSYHAMDVFKEEGMING